MPIFISVGKVVLFVCVKSALIMSFLARTINKTPLNNLLKLSGPDEIRAHIKAIKIIMEKFQRRSQRSSRYTVHTTVWATH